MFKTCSHQQKKQHYCEIFDFLLKRLKNSVIKDDAPCRKNANDAGTKFIEDLSK